MCSYCSIARRMVKANKRHWVWGGLGGLALLLSAYLGCAGSGTKPSLDTRDPQHPLTFEKSEKSAEIKKLWTQRVQGAMTDLSVARGGSAIVVATTPDPDVVLPSNRPLLYRFNAKGKVSWQKEIKTRARSIAISQDGSMVIAVTYNEEMNAFASSGKHLWKAQAMCQPNILSKSKKILCYHDDDAEPQIAFDIYDWKGKKTFSFPITKDILALKVSRDERNIALALTQGEVLLVGPDFKTVWDKKVEGEILDLAVSSGEDPRVAVVYDQDLKSPEKGQRLAVFDANGVLRGQAEIEKHLEKIDIAPLGGAVILYGNNPTGQKLAFYALPEKFPVSSDDEIKLEQTWHRGDPRPADFSSQLVVTSRFIVLGYEDNSSGVRHSHLLGFEHNGKLKWNLPLVTEEGAYLYAHGLTEDGGLLVAGTDDGFLSAFKVSEGAQAPAHAK